MKISKIIVKIIQDSRGKDTLEAEFVSGDFKSISSVPAGKSTGKLEAFALPATEAMEKFGNVKSELLNKDFSSVSEFDNLLLKLDGTDNKSNLGGNLILVLSIAFTKLFAKFNNLKTYQLITQIMGKQKGKFPYLYLNLIGGGLHANKSLPFQEYILVTKFASPQKGLDFALEVVEKLKQDIAENFGEIRVGDEGTFSIDSSNPELGLEVLSRNAKSEEIALALDVAASSFYSEGKYQIGEKSLSSQELLDLYGQFIDKYHLISIEDPFAEDDREGFIKICKDFSDKIKIIGDDLTVTNVQMIERAQNEKAATGVIIKPNQIGSVSETLDAIALAQKYGWMVVVSHRSGETKDDFIADLAYGAGADGLKTGAPTQAVRLAKYNRLIEIEKEIS